MTSGTRPPMVAALVPARGGSKRLPGKNLRPLAGKPMLCYTLEAALGCRGIDEVWVTTDDPEIAAVATAAGSRVLMRPPELSGDDATVAQVVRHFLGACDPLHVMLLQPTSPLRGREYIDRALQVYNERGETGCVVGVCATKPLSWQGSIDESGVFRYHVFPGQPERSNYLLNGALYLTSAARAREHGFVMDPIHPIIMPAEVSIDIDTLEDFLRTELLLAEPG